MKFEEGLVSSDVVTMELASLASLFGPNTAATANSNTSDFQVEINRFFGRIPPNAFNVNPLAVLVN